MDPVCTEQMIELAASPQTRIRIYGRAKAPAPAVLHLHGGAFAGSIDTGRPVATVLAQAGALVIAVDYPCGAAHPFPEALETAYQALCWLGAQHGRRRRLFVAGEESGGNLAASLALVARDRRTPLLAGQILLSPMLDPQLATCSIRTAEAGAAECKWAIGWHDYLGTPDKACHPYAAPANAQRLAGVAPALVLTGPDDPMQDEALAYVARLRDGAIRAECCAVQAGGRWPDALMALAQSGTPDLEPGLLVPRPVAVSPLAVSPIALSRVALSRFSRRRPGSLSAEPRGDAPPSTDPSRAEPPWAEPPWAAEVRTAIAAFLKAAGAIL